MGSEIRITAEDLFHRAADLAVRERKVYLDRACEGNADLRREVEELLSFDESSGAFLEKPALQDAARELAGDLTKSQSQADTLNEEDWTLGPYRIRYQIGKGGMGIVYLALDTRDGREVALKVLPNDSDEDEDRLARFTREGRMLSELKSLKHPNIAEIYEQAEYDGKPCIALEYVPGDTLADRLCQGPLPVKEALQYALQIADALKSAHDQRIVHRDLKPANIKITPEGTIKVLDFGLAKRFYGEIQPGNEHNTRSLSLTESGMLLGTPAYMSPEQWNGQPVDQRADIWAFGCLLYEMLTGEAPFVGRNRAETMKAVFAANPDWNALPKETPLVIQDLLRRCFGRNPANRLGDAGEVRRVIAEAIGNRRFAPLLFIKSQAWKINRQMAWALASTTIALALILAWQYTPLEDWVRLAVGSGIVIMEKDDLATVLSRKVEGADVEQIRAALVPEQQSSIDLLAQKDLLHKNKHYPQAINELIIELNKLIIGGKGSAQIYAILAQAHLFRYYLSSKNEDKYAAVQACEKAQALNPEAFEVQLVLGEMLNALNSPDQAIVILNKALQHPQKPNDTEALYGLALAYDLKGDDNQAEELYERTIDECKSQPSGQSCERYFNELGAFYFMRGKYSQAEANWRKVIEQNQFNPAGHSNLGNALLYQGCIDQAIDAFTQSINRRATVDGYSNRGTAYFFRGDLAQATKDFERVTIDGQDLLDGYRAASLWGNLADAYRLGERVEQAVGAYRKAIELADSHLSPLPNDPDVVAMKADWIAKLNSIGIRDTQPDPVSLIEQTLASSPECKECKGIAVTVYYFAGRRDKALTAMQEAFKDGYSPFLLTQNPETKKLEQERVFQQIVRQFKPTC